MDEVNEPILFHCPITTWMATALPMISPKDPRHPDLYTSSVVEALSQNAEHPLLDAQGFVPLHKLATQPKGSASSPLLDDAIDCIVTNVLLHSQQSFIHKYGHDQNELVSLYKPLFQPLNQDAQNYCLPADPYDIRAISLLSLCSGPGCIEQSNHHLTEAANKIMFDDPCRRYLYGLTIKGNMTTFWRFDRTSILMSEVFDCQKRPEILIQFIVSLGLSRRERLGFDPTVSVAALDAGTSETVISPSFVYQLGGRRYRTIGPPTYIYSSSFLCSSGVRVWTVKEVDENGSWLAAAQEHVLKDFWAQDGHISDTEHQGVIKQRLRDLDKDGGGRTQEMEEYFMKIRHDEVVMIDGQPDVTLAIPDNAAWDEPCFGEAFPISIYQEGNIRSRHYSRPAPRVHHRLLFEEQCMRLTACTEFHVVLDCFKQFCMALDLFRQAEYVHRDISLGNCLVLERNGVFQAKISDLEFCKDYASISPTDPVKGTLEFMAIEAIRKTLIWTDQDLMAPDLHPYSQFHHYHPLYDLESLYWVFIWFVFSREPVACDLPPDDDVYYDWDLQLSEIFDRCYDLDSRRRAFFIVRPDYHARAETMRRLGWPVHHVLDPIFDLYLEWKQTYIQLENSRQDPVTHRWPISHITDSMYRTFEQVLNKIGSDIGEHPFYVRSIGRKLANYEPKIEKVDYSD